jgi:hypothetical protein
MKIIKSAGQELRQDLAELINFVYAKRPLLEYQADDVDPTTNLITSVTVWQDGQSLGHVDVSFNRYNATRGCNEKWIKVTCRNIKKVRGQYRNAKFTKNVKGAAALVVELFTKRSLNEIGVKIALTVRDAIEELHREVEYRYKNVIGVNKDILIPYFMEVLEGNNPPIPSNIASQLTTEDSKKRIADMHIAKNVYGYFEAKDGYVAQIMQDESILCCDIASGQTVKYASTFEMNTAMQEKFTILKLLEANQFAADIGIKVKIEDRIKTQFMYFVVGGDTKTT